MLPIVNSSQADTDISGLHKAKLINAIRYMEGSMTMGRSDSLESLDTSKYNEIGSIISELDSNTDTTLEEGFDKLSKQLKSIINEDRNNNIASKVEDISNSFETLKTEVSSLELSSVIKVESLIEKMADSSKESIEILSNEIQSELSKLTDTLPSSNKSVSETVSKMEDSIRDVVSLSAGYLQEVSSIRETIESINYSGLDSVEIQSSLKDVETSLTEGVSEGILESSKQLAETILSEYNAGQTSFVERREVNTPVLIDRRVSTRTDVESKSDMMSLSDARSEFASEFLSDFNKINSDNKEQVIEYISAAEQTVRESDIRQGMIESLKAISSSENTLSEILEGTNVSNKNELMILEVLKDSSVQTQGVIPIPMNPGNPGSPGGSAPAGGGSGDSPKSNVFKRFDNLQQGFKSEYENELGPVFAPIVGAMGDLLTSGFSKINPFSRKQKNGSDTEDSFGEENIKQYSVGGGSENTEISLLQQNIENSETNIQNSEDMKDSLESIYNILDDRLPSAEDEREANRRNKNTPLLNGKSETTESSEETSILDMINSMAEGAGKLVAGIATAGTAIATAGKTVTSKSVFNKVMGKPDTVSKTTNSQIEKQNKSSQLEKQSQIEKDSKSKMKIGKFAKGLGPIGTAIGIYEGVSSAYETNNEISELQEAGTLTKETASEMKQDNVERTGSSMAGGTAAGIAGAKIGAALGSVVPVVGTAIGALVGGGLGYLAGSGVGESLYNFFSGSEEEKAETRIKELVDKQINAGLSEVEMKELQYLTEESGFDTKEYTQSKIDSMKDSSSVSSDTTMNGQTESIENYKFEDKMLGREFTIESAEGFTDKEQLAEYASSKYELDNIQRTLNMRQSDSKEESQISEREVSLMSRRDELNERIEKLGVGDYKLNYSTSPVVNNMSSQIQSSIEDNAQSSISELEGSNSQSQTISENDMTQLSSYESKNMVIDNTMSNMNQAGGSAGGNSTNIVAPNTSNDNKVINNNSSTTIINAPDTDPVIRKISNNTSWAVL